MSLLLISFFLCIVISYSLWYFVFNIYEVKFEIITGEKLGVQEIINEVRSIPVNLLGYKVPFRKPDFDFEIKEGSDLITIIPRNHNNELYFSSSNNSGIVVFKLKTELSLFPQILEFNLATGK